MKKPTLKDVARKAGVDPSTASRVLNQSFDDHRYAASTVQAVQEAARDLNYQASITAKSLRTGKSQIIALLVPRISNPFFADLAECIEQIARKHHYRVMISSTGSSSEFQREHLKSLAAVQVDGFIVAPMNNQGLHELNHAGRPWVSIDLQPAEVDCSHFGLDDHAAGAMAASLIIQKGYKKVALIGPGLSKTSHFDRRMQGFTDALPDDIDISFYAKVETPIRQRCAELVQGSLLEGISTQAWIGLNNVCTMGIMQGLSQEGLRIGEDCALLGIDEFFGASTLHPGISVIAQPVQQMAEQAFLHLLSEINSGPQSSPTIKRFPPILRDRGSLPPATELRPR